jgi:uncharacterized protein
MRPARLRGKNYCKSLWYEPRLFCGARTYACRVETRLDTFAEASTKVSTRHTRVRAPRQESMKCPICKKDVTLDNPEMPFCSERCRLIDLGNWASEKYVISEPADLATEDEEE